MSTESAAFEAWYIANRGDRKYLVMQDSGDYLFTHVEDEWQPFSGGWQSAIASQSARIAELEADNAEQCRLHGIGGSREARLLARIAQASQQEPVAWMRCDHNGVVRYTSNRPREGFGDTVRPLYFASPAATGASGRAAEGRDNSACVRCKHLRQWHDRQYGCGEDGCQCESFLAPPSTARVNDELVAALTDKLIESALDSDASGRPDGSLARYAMELRAALARAKEQS